MPRATRRSSNRAETPAPKTNVPAKVGDNPFIAFAGSVGSAGGKTIYAKFNGNTGQFHYGTPSREIEPGTEILIDMNLAIKHGWICWNDSKVVDEVMVSITEGSPPAEHQLKDHSPYVKEGDGWKEQVSMLFKIVETGEDVELKMTSRAGIRAVGGLSKAYGAVFRDHDPEDLIIVTIDSKDYPPRDKSYGRKYAPIFDISEFVSPDDAADLLGEEDDAPEDDEDQGTATNTSQDEGEAPVDDEGEIPTVDDDEDETDTPPVKKEAPKEGGRRSRRATRRI